MITQEEIEKIEKGCGRGINKYTCGEFFPREFSNTPFPQGRISCPICQRAKQERIKTSIQWCKAWIENLQNKLTIKDDWEKHKEDIKQLQTHLTWLKKQEDSK